MLFASNPLLSAIDELAAGCHRHFTMVDCRLVTGVDGTVEATLNLARDEPPSRRGHLIVRCEFDAGDTMTLRYQREIEAEEQWLPEDVTLRLGIQWRPRSAAEAEATDPDALLAAALAAPMCAVDAHAWVRRGEVHSSRAAALAGAGPQPELMVAIEDHLTLPQVHARDWARFAEQLAQLVERLHDTL